MSDTTPAQRSYALNPEWQDLDETFERLITDLDVRVHDFRQIKWGVKHCGTAPA